LPVTPNQFDLDPWLLNVENGTLDLRTGELSPHRREDLITKLAPVEYDAVAECLLWLKVLKRIMAGNESLIGYMQRMLGMCLTGDISVQELFIFWGVGANGKNTLLDTIIGLMGDYACIAPPNLLTAKGRNEHPTEIADLFGKRLVVASETDEGRRLRTSMVKQITGDLYLKGRHMRQDFFQFRRTHTTVLVTNNKPVVRESTKAMWRRIRLVPFNVVIPEAEWKLGLLDELRAEWPGIMRWLVQGCLSWQRDGLGTPEAVTAATAEYRSEQDQFQQFVDESCQIGADLFVTRGDVCRAFQDWAQRVSENRPLGRILIYERLRAAGYAEGYKTVAGKRTRVFRGIGLLHDDGAQQCTGRNSDSPSAPYEADL
jgi:putative DNA primase/helicase